MAHNPGKFGGIPADNARRGKRRVSQVDSDEVVSLKNVFPPLGIFVVGDRHLCLSHCCDHGQQTSFAVHWQLVKLGSTEMTEEVCDTAIHEFSCILSK